MKFFSKGLMTLTRTELEILAGEREKFPRELVDKCLKNFRERGLLHGDEDDLR